MKKKIIAVISVMVVLISIFLVGTGFQKRTDAVLVDYSVSEDGTEITLNVGIPTSMGYIRGFKDNGGGVKPHYLTFYSTFGGINSPIGAKNSFILELASDDTEIYFNRPDKGFELVLVKDEETGQWLKPSGMDEGDHTILEAVILEIHDNYFLVEPVEGSQELNSADRITVPMKNMSPSPEPEVGDIIKITYNGELAESYPAQITEVYSIKVVKDIGEEADEIIIYNGKEYRKSELSNATLQWLELSEPEKIASSYMPPEFMSFEENWGITLEVENITPTSITLKCTQHEGEPIGELQTGSWYIVESWTQENGWKEVDHILQDDIGWTEEAWMIPADSISEWEVNWEWLYGELPTGQYRIGKEITDFRATGDYDTAIYYAEFEIAE
ncbi:MAG: immunoglobulin-like domain-containing protein [Lachnospiraceae bacterium]